MIAYNDPSSNREDYKITIVSANSMESSFSIVKVVLFLEDGTSVCNVDANTDLKLFKRKSSTNSTLYGYLYIAHTSPVTTGSSYDLLNIKCNSLDHHFEVVQYLGTGITEIAHYIGHTIKTSDIYGKAEIFGNTKTFAPVTNIVIYNRFVL